MLKLVKKTSCSLVLLLAAAVACGGRVQAQTPRLSISQVGLHFICTADGQPDMYSWRMPVKDMGEEATERDYKIPEFVPTDSKISGGRTALCVDENVFAGNGDPVIHYDYATGFNGSDARLTNLNEVHWGDPQQMRPGALKARYYSNFPPLSHPDQPGHYGTRYGEYVGGNHYGFDFTKHPGYDPRNWNWTLDRDTPLAPNEKRIQAMLHLEMRLPEGGNPDEDLNYTFVISGEDMASLRVNGMPVFSRGNIPVAIKMQKSLFAGTPDGLHTFADTRRLARGRRNPGHSSMPSDEGYFYDPQSTGMSLNLDLTSQYFTVQNDRTMIFSSGPVTIKIYDKHVAATTTELPVQTVQFSFPEGYAPAPDLVTMGSAKVNFLQTSGTPYGHPAIQAPRWWSFTRDGSVERSTYGSLISVSSSSLRGRFFEWPGYLVMSDRVAINPQASPEGYRQRVPGARALIYGYDELLYPDVGQISASELAQNPARRIEYVAPNYNRPVHYGTDTLRLLKNVNPLVARTHVSASEFTVDKNYLYSFSHLAPGFAEEQPLITTHPVSATLEKGQQTRLEVSVGNGPVSYQWRFNGEPIAGATQSILTVADMSPAKAGAYDAVATNIKGSTVSKPAVLRMPGAFILTQPLGMTVATGETATLTVVAEGSGLSYQWRKDTLAIPQATTATLTLKNIKAADVGSYDVVIENADGVVVSEVAELRLKTPLAIVQQPVGGHLRQGSELVLQVHAVGQGTLSYVWRRDGQVVAAAVNDRLVLTGANEGAEAGSYVVEVSDGNATVTSAKVQVVSVGYPPVIAQQPVSQTVGLNAAATFAVVAEGSNLTYQWRRDGANIAKANGATLVVNPVTPKSLGSYDCVVGNDHGRTLTEAATLSLASSLNFALKPADQTAAPGETATFSALAAEEDRLATYQWAFNGKAIAGAIYPDFSLPRVTANHGGIYSVTLSLNNEQVTASARLKIHEPGVAVYKLSGTGQTTTGAETARVGMKGFLILDRSFDPPVGAMLLVSKDGRYNRYEQRTLNALRVDSTGPATKTQTAISAVTNDEVEPPFRSLFWMQGVDSIVKLSKTDQMLAPKTLSGSAHQLVIGGETEKVTLETVSFKAAMDLGSTAIARQNGENLLETTERLKVTLQLQGALEAPEGR